MSVLDNWHQWQEFLGDRLDHAQNQGMSEGAINNLAVQIGDYLARNVDPKNEQERVLSDMWSVASPQEQQAIASVMVKLVKQ
ncbi:DUF3243 domain-containing protein [Bacillus sp. BRMEA1]|uniref:DUF3243 domain-containing protein n=1 Tax=Neobacillus endophyticus TaxID=2738405 RepID=UPI001565CE08|nr:DUF3243 domain-containing protein [Neobacillus endophyticus]NRD78907.1 DUF3243 domain-containing protein [Neobacillus endophyticus]